MKYPILNSLSRHLVRRLIVLLAVFGLVFTIGGCGPTPDPYKEQELRELRELQARLPSYYLTAKEIGTGYKLWRHSYSSLKVADCIRAQMSSVDIYASYDNYDVPGKHQVIILLVDEIKKRKLGSDGDIAAKLSIAYDKECKKENLLESKDGDTRWKILRSSRVKDLSHNGFGFRATEWRPTIKGVIPYPPTQKQLEIDTRIAANSGAYAYGRIGEYIVTVFGGIGSVVPGAGTAIGAAVGGVIAGSFLGHSAGKAVSDGIFGR